MKDGRICLFALGDIFFCTTVLHRSSGYKHVWTSFLLLRHIETTLKAGWDFRIQVVHLWYDHQVVGGWLKKNVFGKTRWLWPVLFMDPEWSEWSEWCGSGLGILLIVLEHPVAPVNISGPEAPHAPQLVSNWRDHDMVIPFGRWERNSWWNHPARWEPFSQTKVICRPWKIKKLGATGWAHPQWQDTAMRNPPPWQPRRHTPVAARKHCPDSSWTKQCTSQVSGQIGSPGGLSMGVLPRDYFTCRSIPFIVWFFVESGMENIQIKRCVWNMQFSTEHLAIAQKWGTNWPTVILIE